MHNNIAVEQEVINKIDPKVQTVRDLICLANLTIPEYQRPYKWQSKNVKQLIEDVLLHEKKSAYRIGTVVIYDKSKDIYTDQEETKKDYFHIVDGQQRLITLTLIAYSLLNEPNTKEIAEKIITSSQLSLLKVKFTSDITKNNMALNYDIIKREISHFTVDEIKFFFNKCELICITLTDISEAFQFFDSQNDRGKGLDPHDLLKAFHLREMSSLNELEKAACIKDWEEKEDRELQDLFSNYLFRVRRWSKRKQGRYLNSNNASTFKGVTLDDSLNYPYAYPLRINNVFTDEFNTHLHRKIDLNIKPYPFQIDQVIINGKRFFEMIAFYQYKVNQIKQTHNIINIKNEKGRFVKGTIDKKDLLKKLQFLEVKSEKDIVYRIFETLASYIGRNRTGDKYVRNIFDCALLYYIDKFGNKNLDKVLVKLFVWAYSLRLTSKAVQLASADNHAVVWNSVFNVIREATQPKEVYNVDLGKVEIQSTNTKKIETLFTELKYI
jgi:hypothetical protein